MLIETIFSMLTRVVEESIASVLDLFQDTPCFHYGGDNLLVQWDGLPANEDGFVPLSIAQFTL